MPNNNFIGTKTNIHLPPIVKRFQKGQLVTNTTRKAVNANTRRTTISHPNLRTMTVGSRLFTPQPVRKTRRVGRRRRV